MNASVYVQEKANEVCPINLQAVLRNGGSDDIPFMYQTSFNQALLERPSDYYAAITRVRVPFTRVQTLVLPDDPSSYQVVIGGTNLNTSTYVDYATTLPNHLDADATYYYGPVLYYRPLTVLDVLNRCIYNSYANFVKTFGSNYQLIRNSTLVYDSATNAAGSTSVNVTFSSTKLGSISHIEIDITNIVASTTTWSNASPGAVTQSGGIYTLTLTSPGGKVLTVLSLPASKISLSGTKTIRLTEAAFNSTYGQLNDTASSKSIHMYLPPSESFFDLASQTAAGTWTLTMTSSVAIYGKIDYTIRLYSTPTAYPDDAPIFSLDSNDCLTLMYNRAFSETGGLSLKFSAAVKQMLDYGDRYYRKSGNYYEFLFESLSGDNAYITITQSNSTLFRLSNVNRILVVSNTLNADGDLFISNGNVTNYLTLSDFAITDFSNDLSALTYSNESSIRPWRIYRIKNSSPLRSIDLSVLTEYDNGAIRQLYIAPQDVGSIRLSFFKK